MAEAGAISALEKIASSMAGQALDRIGKRVSDLLAVKSSMKQIKSEFVVMQAFITEVKAHDTPNKTFVAWSEEIKMVAVDVEAIIDEYTYLTYLVGEESDCGFINFLKKAFRHSKNFAAWHGIVTQLKEVETRLEKLTTMKDRYSILVNKIEDKMRRSSVSDSAAHRQRRVFDFSHMSHEDEIVGHDAETKELIQWLTDGKEARTVISISGVEGLGKTTLAKSIYKNPTVKSHFECSIWITVSESYRVEDLLRRILEHNEGKNKEKMRVRAVVNKKDISLCIQLPQFRIPNSKNEAIPNDIDTAVQSELEKKVQIYLRGKRYLIILDDVWSIDDWDLLDRVLEKNDKGSRVVITTREEGVAALADENRRLRLSTLQKKEAEDLFYKKAFPRLAEKCCLEHWAVKIVDKCQGLPLAIVAIGSLLSYKEPQEREWESFYNQLNWQLSNNPELNWVESVLNLSYNDLPSYLKNCFLYCSLFPEDYLIDREWLIRLWTAEGFIEERDPKSTIEEVADSYVKELVQRSMLQVVEWDDFGKAETLQIHDLVREITLKMSRDEKFGIVCNNNSPGATMLSEQARRLSIHERVSDLQPNANLRQLRSFILFNNELPPSRIKKTTSNFKLLRVLCMRNAKIEQIPDAVFDLFNLHYLELQSTKVKSIPRALGKLHNLQTLDLRVTRVKKLPREIRTLTKLRHLFVDCYYGIFNYLSAASVPHDICRLKGLHALANIIDCFSAASVPNDICRLKDLQTLANIEANKLLMRNIRSLTSLRNLFAMKVRRAWCADLWASLKMMPRLASLGVVARNKDELLCLDCVQPLPSLQKLYLKGRLDEDKAPTVFANFGQLQDLRLGWSGLQKDPLHCFSHMSSLVNLHLYQIYEGRQLSFRAGWFPMLKQLVLADMVRVSDIDIDDGAMESLYELELIGMSNLMAVPAGVVYLRSLQEIFLTDMPQEFTSSFKGIDWSEVQHIPRVNWRTAL